MFIDRRLGNTPRFFIAEPRDWRMNVPDVALKNVVFIGQIESVGESEQITWMGTGFLVLVPAPGAADFAYYYLVTVKHLAAKLESRRWCVRVNTNDGKSIRIDGDADVRWWYHPTEEASVDCAVTPFGVSEEQNIDAKLVPLSMFATDDVIEENGIGEGDEVFVIGLFTRLAGDERNIPIVRTGNIAMMPKEPLPAKIDDYIGPIDAYLIETRSMGGISGSPVFVRETIYTKDVVVKNEGTGKEKKTVTLMPGQFYLLGISHGHWNIHPSEHNRNDWRAASKASESIALGISIVVPAKKILEILNRSELVQHRQQDYMAWKLRYADNST